MFNSALHATTSCATIYAVTIPCPKVTQFPWKFLLISLARCTCGVYPAQKSTKTNQKCSPEKCRVMGRRGTRGFSPFPKRMNNSSRSRKTFPLTTHSWHLQLCFMLFGGGSLRKNSIKKAQNVWNGCTSSQSNLFMAFHLNRFLFPSVFYF